MITYSYRITFLVRKKDIREGTVVYVASQNCYATRDRCVFSDRRDSFGGAILRSAEAMYGLDGGIGSGGLVTCRLENLTNEEHKRQQEEKQRRLEETKTKFDKTKKTSSSKVSSNASPASDNSYHITKKDMETFGCILKILIPFAIVYYTYMKCSGYLDDNNNKPRQEQVEKKTHSTNKNKNKSKKRKSKQQASKTVTNENDIAPNVEPENVESSEQAQESRAPAEIMESKHEENMEGSTTNQELESQDNSTTE